MEADEARMLAPYGQKSGESRGRKFAEPKHEFRTDFQRDRARIIHSRAFRRLEYKTQVFLNGTGDHLRTRLTHTIEVASISRTIARALRLNEDLAEAIALAHDLGHAPFGHSGEEMLAECMREHGGFEHNRQSLRVVELLENPYPDFPGLNLTAELRAGLMKHEGDEARGSSVEGAEERNPEACTTLEAQVADLADEITYYSHDLDDALDFEILSFEQLEDVAVWKQSAATVRAKYSAVPEPVLHKLIIRQIIDRAVRDVIGTSAANLRQPGSSGSAKLIKYSDELSAANHELRKFLYANVYHHPHVAEVNRRACEMLREVFAAYVREPERLGAGAAGRIEAEGLERAVCDYIAGMTDRYLMDEFTRIAR
ncbi:MAG: deoxyguanosinetriphosphate triphosphohydrolase [Verrucomicrobia bacterium]|nr:deoxyguanosinetriphosphate triphosphohydrolase [Verrucomicrobiota bacterium]